MSEGLVMVESKEKEIKFGLEEDVRFEAVDPVVCEYHKIGESFCIQETTKDKSTKQAVITEEVIIETEYPCFAVSPLDKKVETLPFIRQGKGFHEITRHADHAVVLFDTETKTWILHVFEMKHTTNTSRWEHICEQFNGAMIRVYAIAGVLRIRDFAKVYFHRCCRKSLSREAPGKHSQMVELRTYPELNKRNVPVWLDSTGRAIIRLDGHGCTALYPSTKRHLP